jgi:hypothetical protein
MLTRYVDPPTAFAQNPAPTSKEIRAQSFTLVDSANGTVGAFTTEVGAPTALPGVAPIPPTSNPSPVPPSGRGPSAPRIVLRDSSGREIMEPRRARQELCQRYSDEAEVTHHPKSLPGLPNLYAGYAVLEFFCY